MLSFQVRPMCPLFSNNKVGMISSPIGSCEVLLDALETKPAIAQSKTVAKVKTKGKILLNQYIRRAMW